MSTATHAPPALESAPRAAKPPDAKPPDDTAPASRRGEPTWEVVRLYPQQGEWTEEAYLAIRGQFGGIVELSDGCLEFPAVPSTPIHQDLMLFFLDRLRQHVEPRKLGRVYPAPLGVRLWKGKWREPDLMFVRPEQVPDRHRQPTGADLVLEVVSPHPDDRQRDLEEKRAEYATAGFAEYWIVDPETRTITVLTLDGVPAGGPYRVHGEFRTGQTAASVLLPGFTAKVDAVFAAGENDAADHAQGSDPAQGEPS